MMISLEILPIWRRVSMCFIACACGIALAALPIDAAGAQSGDHGELVGRQAVTGVRVSQHNNFTRFTLDLTGPVRFRVRAAGGPYRLVVDLPSVEWRLAPAISVGGSGLISEIAFRPGKEGRAQIVAAVRGPFQVEKTFALRPRGRAQSWRLVIDLEPVSKDAFDRQHRAGHKAKRSANRTADARQPKARGPANAPLVVIDPGHGGVDAGAISRWGLREKDVVLRFSKALAAALLATGRYRVLLTRSGDRFRALRARYEMARRARANLLLSIHADAHPSARMRGLSVHTLSAKASDQLAARLAQRENKSDLIAGVNLADQSAPVTGILIDLVRRETMVASVRLAKQIVFEAGRVTRLLPDARRSARFVVLKAPEVPSLLIELGFLTNRQDERKLRRKAHLRRVALAFVRAIDRYFRVSGQRPKTDHRTNRRKAPQTTPQTARQPAAGVRERRD